MANVKPELQEKWNALSADARGLLVMAGRLSDKGIALELLRCVWSAGADNDGEARFSAALAELDADGAWFATKKAEIRKLKSPSRRALPALAEKDESAAGMSDERLFDLVSGLAYGEIAAAFARTDWSKDPTTNEDATAQIVYLAPKMTGFRYLEAKCVEAARFFMQRDRNRYLSREAKLAEELDEADLPDNFGQALALHQTSFRAWMHRDEAAGTMDQLPSRPEYAAAALNKMTEGLARLKPGENVSPFFAAALYLGVASAWQTDLVNQTKALEVLRAGLPVLETAPAYPDSEQYPESAWGALVKTMYPIALQTLERQLGIPETEQAFAGRRMLAPPERFPSFFSIGDLLALDRSEHMYKGQFDDGVKETVAARARANMMKIIGGEADPVANMKSPLPMIKKASETWPGVIEALRTVESPEAFTVALCRDPELFLSLSTGLRGGDLYAVYDGFLDELEPRGFAPERLPEAGRIMIAVLLYTRASSEITDLSPEKPSVIALEHLRRLPRFGFDLAWLRFIDYIVREFADTWHPDANDALVEGIGRLVDETRVPEEGAVQPEALKLVAAALRQSEMLYRPNQEPLVDEYRDRMFELGERIDALIPEAKTPRDFFALGKTTLIWAKDFGRFDVFPAFDDQVEELVRAMQHNGASALAPAIFARRVMLAADQQEPLNEEDRADLDEALEIAINLADDYDPAVFAPGADFLPEAREWRNLSLWLFNVYPNAAYGQTDGHDLRDLLLTLLWAETVQCLRLLKRKTPGKFEGDAKRLRETRDANIKALEAYRDKVENALRAPGRIDDPEKMVREVFDYNYGFALRNKFLD